MTFSRKLMSPNSTVGPGPCQGGRERKSLNDRVLTPSGSIPEAVYRSSLAQDRLSEALHHTVALSRFLAQSHDMVTLRLRERGDSDEDFVHLLLASDTRDGLSSAENRQAVNALSSLGQVVVDETHGLIRKLRIVANLPKDHLPGVPGPYDQQSPAAAGQPGKILPKESEEHPASGDQNQEQQGVQNKYHPRITVEMCQSYQGQHGYNR